MTRNLFASALFAGLAAGVLAALLQLTFVVPLLLEGELYETGTRTHFTATGVQSDAGTPPVFDQMSRHIGTVAMNLITYTGFALVLVAGFAFANRFGHVIDARQGALWGLMGFISLHLAPAFGLPPELPGTVGADLQPRQIWWSATALATAIGIALIAYRKGPVLVAAGIVLIALPHLIGAPQIDTYFGTAPPELASHFVTRSLGVAALSWIALGAMAGALWSRRT